MRVATHGLWSVRFICLSAAARVAVCLVVLAALLSFRAPVSANAPHPGLDFSLGIDTNGNSIDDCATSGGLTKCNIRLGSTFAVKLYLNSIGTVPGYESYDATVLFSGVSAKYNSNQSFWPDCVGPLYAGPIVGVVGWGCVVGQFDPPSTYTGLIGTTDFNCTQNGTVSVLHGAGNTQIVDSGFGQHGEAQDTTETLTINCVQPIGGLSYDPLVNDTRSSPGGGGGPFLATWIALAAFAGAAFSFALAAIAAPRRRRR